MYVCKRVFSSKYCNCISKRLSKGFFSKPKFDFQQSKKLYLHRVAQKPLDAALVLLNIE